jgi:uncharacterized membrane protein YphA (DoxX/SURF4 family)
MFSFKTVSGIVLIIFGVFGAAYGLFTYGSQLKNMQLCNSLPITFNQINVKICSKLPDVLTLGIIFELIGTLSLLIGIIIIVSVQKQKKSKNNDIK